MKTIYTSLFAILIFTFLICYQSIASSVTESDPIIEKNSIQVLSLKKIYPNPVKDKLQLELSIGEMEGDIQVEVYNMLGSVIYKKKFADFDSSYQKLELDLSELHSGIYIVKLEKNKKAITTKIRKL